MRAERRPPGAWGLGDVRNGPQARREAPGGAGGVANDDPALGCPEGAARLFGPAESAGSRGSAPGERAGRMAGTAGARIRPV